MTKKFSATWERPLCKVVLGIGEEGELSVPSMASCTLLPPPPHPPKYMIIFIITIITIKDLVEAGGRVASEDGLREV